MLFLGAVVATLAACVPVAPTPVTATSTTNPTAAIVAQATASREPTATPAATATPEPAATATLEPTAMPTSTPEPSPTPEPTATPTSTPVNQLTIAYMREAQYLGSDVVIEQTLQPGANYQRYLASYLSEGLKIYGLLTIPNGEKPVTGWPAIVFNHGYIPPEQYRTTERYVAYVDGFARNGYIVFKIDFRGHGSSEGEPVGGYGAPGYTIDALNAVASIKRHTAVDPNRIGMWGHSMGGHVTLRAMVTTQDIKAGVIWAGVVATYPDLINNWRRPSNAPPLNIPERVRRWRQEFIDSYGGPDVNPAFWASISPSEYVADLSGPVQLHHATGDVEVPIEFSRDLNERINAAGGMVEYYEYRGDNHNISGNFNTAMQRSIAFFDKHVKGAQ
jgi:uncharacterized protein